MTSTNRAAMALIVMTGGAAFFFVIAVCLGVIQ